MNSDSPKYPREELEARVTALLLGQLSPDEAAKLRQTIAQDADLARLHNRLKLAIELARETVRAPHQADLVKPDALKLAPERRARLLESFAAPKTVKLAVQARVPRRELLAMAAMVVALLAVAGIMSLNLDSSLNPLPASRERFLASDKREYELLAGEKVQAGDQLAWSAPQRGNFAKESLEEHQMWRELGREVERSTTASQTPPAKPAAGPGAVPQLPESRASAPQNRSENTASSFLSGDPAPIGLLEHGNLVVKDGAETLTGWESLGLPKSALVVKDAGSGTSDLQRNSGRIVLPPLQLEASLSETTPGGGSGARQSSMSDFFAESKLQSANEPAPAASARAGMGGGGGAGGPLPQKQTDPRGALVSTPDSAKAIDLFGSTSERGQSLAWFGQNSKGVDDKKNIQSFADSTTPELFLRKRMSGDAGGPPAPAPARPDPAVEPATGLPISSLNITAGAALAQSGYASINGSTMGEPMSVIPGALGNKITIINPEPGGLATTDGGLLGGKALGDLGGVRDEAAAANPFIARWKYDAVPNAAPLAPPDSAQRLPVTDRERLGGVAGRVDGLGSTLQEKKDFNGDGSTPATELDISGRSAVGTDSSKTTAPEPYRRRLEIALPLQREQEKRESQVAAAYPVIIDEIRFNTGETNARSLNEGRTEVAATNTQPPSPPANQPADARSAEVTTLRRQLDNLRYGRERVQARLTQETTDATLPKNSIVEIIDPAEAASAKRPSLLEKLGKTFTGDIERSARISVQKESTDIQGLNNGGTYAQFDPYWVQTEREKILSKIVLYKVAENLKLNETWAAKHRGGDTLKTEDTYKLLRKMTTVSSDPKTGLMEIKVKSDRPEEAARIANTIAEVYRDQRLQKSQQVNLRGVEALKQQIAKEDEQIAKVAQELERRQKELGSQQADVSLPKPATTAGIPQPEITTIENSFSTFSLNVSDVSFKLAAASLEKGAMPDPASVRTEEFINAFDYRDPEPMGSAPIAFAFERARYPFAHDRDLVRLSVKTAASGRQPGRPLNLVLLLDNSGSMERADRLRIRQECLRVLASQLQPQDRVSVVSFARTARLSVDGLSGSQAGELSQRVGELTPEGGTNLEEAMNLAYQTALRHYLAGGVNRVVLLTDGAANLGDVTPESLKKKVEANRQQGIALDCFGIGWEGYNDDLLEVLSRNGDGRYGFVNTPEAAASEFAGQLAGALKVAASDVKVQVEFNPRRVTTFRQLGYAKHQLKKEQFRDNTVDAAEIGAAEAGNALYVVQVNPRGEGPLATVRVRFKVPATSDYREHEWPVPYEGAAKSLEQSPASMRLAAAASAFSEWLVSSPYAAEVTPDRLLGYLSGVPESQPADPRPKKLEWMIRQARSVAGK